jgi:hypothetical protein
MKEKPIIFSTPMVKALLNTKSDVWPPEPVDGEKPFKWQTRRVIKPQPENVIGELYIDEIHRRLVDVYPPGTVHKRSFFNKLCTTPFSTGDILYVRETFTNAPNGDYIYRADPIFDGCGKGDIPWDWTSSIFLPRKAARIFLEVKSVRMERLQDITEEDAIAEGFENRLSIIDGLTRELMEKASNNPAKANFIRLWNNLDRNHTGYDWEDNPLVWVIEFRRIEK